MTDTPRRRVGRPAKRVLSRDQILVVALKLLDERGQDGFGMREIAREMGVQPSALYNHVSGHGDVIAGVRELIGQRMDHSHFDTLPWDEALTKWSLSYRDAFTAHPQTIALLAVTPVAPESHISLMYEQVLGALRQAGWPEEEVLSVLVTVESFILGAALDAVADDEMLNPGDREELPIFRDAHAARKRAIGTRRPTDVAFELGLDALITGLRCRLASSQQVALG